MRINGFSKIFADEFCFNCDFVQAVMSIGAVLLRSAFVTFRPWPIHVRQGAAGAKVPLGRVQTVDPKAKVHYTVGMQKSFEELTIEQYNNLLSDGAPTPGGGSALCQVAAMACSLLEMAVAITLKRADAEQNRAYLGSQKEAIGRIRRALYKLSNEDAAAFDRIAEGQKLPKGTPEQQKLRTQQLQKAYHKAALVPLDVMGLCKETARIATVRVQPLLSKYVLEDCTIALQLLRTVAQGCALNVQANTVLIDDPQLADTLQRRCAELADFDRF